MPIYAYRCVECGFAKDVLQKLSDAPLTQCPECGKPAFSKQVTAAGFQLKGSGWYVTDFRGGNGSAGGEGKSSGEAKAPGEAKGSGEAKASGEAKRSGEAQGSGEAKSSSEAKASGKTSSGAASASSAPAGPAA